MRWIARWDSALEWRRQNGLAYLLNCLLDYVLDYLLNYVLNYVLKAALPHPRKPDHNKCITNRRQREQTFLLPGITRKAACGAVQQRFERNFAPKFNLRVSQEYLRNFLARAAGSNFGWPQQAYDFLPCHAPSKYCEKRYADCHFIVVIFRPKQYKYCKTARTTCACAKYIDARPRKRERHKKCGAGIRCKGCRGCQPKIRCIPMHLLYYQ